MSDGFHPDTNCGDQLSDLLQKVSDLGLEQLHVFSQVPESRGRCQPISDWLQRSVVAEYDRRQFKAAEHPDIGLTDYPHGELANAAFVTNMWEHAGCDGSVEGFTKFVHQCVLAEVIIRLHQMEPNPC